MRLRLLTCFVLAGPLAGCSLLFTSGPPPASQRSKAFACTTSPVAPLLDLAWAGYLLAAASAEQRDGISGGDIAISALWLGSAAYGIWNGVECRKAIDDAERRVDDPSLQLRPLPRAPVPDASPSPSRNCTGPVRPPSQVSMSPSDLLGSASPSNKQSLLPEKVSRPSLSTTSVRQAGECGGGSPRLGTRSLRAMGALR